MLDRCIEDYKGLDGNKDISTTLDEPTASSSVDEKSVDENSGFERIVKAHSS